MPTVVLVHGLAADTRQWRPQFEHLQGHAQVLAYDQRGHGRSGWNGKDHADVERLGTDLAQVLDAYDLDNRSSPVVVVGHSLGGMAVLALARQRPELFGNAVVAVGLISTSSGELETAVLPRWHSWAPHRLWQVVAELPWALAPLTQRLAPFRSRTGQRLLFRHLFGAGPVPADVKSLMRETWMRTPRAVTASFFPALLDYGTESALPALAKVPTLVLAGSADATIPFDHSRRLAEQVDSAELVCVEGAGHMVGLTHADEVNKAIVELLRRV